MEILTRTDDTFAEFDQFAQIDAEAGLTFQEYSDPELDAQRHAEAVNNNQEAEQTKEEEAHRSVLAPWLGFISIHHRS